MATQRRRKKSRKDKKFTISYKLYYWITGIVVLIALLFFFRTTLVMYYYIIKEKFEEREYGYMDLERMRKETEVQKIQAIIQKYRGNPFGIDISEHQGNIKWDSLGVLKKDLPISFIFVRATRGASAQDVFFNKNWNNLKKKNLLRGAYHY